LVKDPEEKPKNPSTSLIVRKEITEDKEGKKKSGKSRLFFFNIYNIKKKLTMKHLKNFRVFEEAPSFDIEHPSISGGYTKKAFTAAEIEFLRKYDKDLETVQKDGEIYEIIFKEESKYEVKFVVKVTKHNTQYLVKFETLDGKPLLVYASYNYLGNKKSVESFDMVPLAIRDGIIAANKLDPNASENPHSEEPAPQPKRNTGSSAKKSWLPKFLRPSSVEWIDGDTED
jgi:hypothetical protein